MPRFNRRRNPHHGRQQRQPRGAMREDRAAPDRLPRGLTTPRSYYRRFILQLLRQAEGHWGPSREVRRTMQMRLAARLTPADRHLLRRNLPPWVNSMQWERKQMVADGLLEPTAVAGHGIWSLTPKGIREAEH